MELSITVETMHEFHVAALKFKNAGMTYDLHPDTLRLVKSALVRGAPIHLSNKFYHSNEVVNQMLVGFSTEFYQKV